MCKACYQQIRAVKVALTCAWCGKGFERPLYEHERALKRGMKDAYCCKVCAQAHHAIKNAKACGHCGKAMPGRRGERYCSVECKIAARAAAKKTLPDRACLWCGTTFTPKVAKAQHCSRTCADAAHSQRMKGKGNSNYKTGTSYAKWYAEMRPLIMERDDHCCVVCQSKAQTEVVTWKGQQVSRTTLTIHHINEDPADNAPENLVTLCKTCHAIHHKSAQTPWPWLGVYAQVKSQSMTSKWKKIITSLRQMYSPTTA
jgi:5-methylcytosine-specific restriction endonuclease McrA